MSWRSARVCAGLDPNIFFPDGDEDLNAERAKRICADCPVRRECLEYALETGQKHGIWGGVTTNGRKRIRRRRRQAAAA